jgi:hypothetical protein
MSIDVQAVTLAEAVVLLMVNVLGALLTLLAWAVSDLDVREARNSAALGEGGADDIRVRHNRLVITEDGRHGENRRLLAHVMIAIIGVFWLLTPQPVNPGVVWWAVAIRAIAVTLSCLLIDKTLHHLIARYRFDRPWLNGNRWSLIWPALQLAWADMQDRSDLRPRSTPRRS